MAVGLSGVDAAVQVGVDADTGGYDKAVANLGKTTTSAVNKMNTSMADSFNALGQSMTKTGKVMSLAVTAPLVAIGLAAAKTSIEFVKLYESTMIVFDKMLGGKDAAQSLYIELLNIAKASTYSQETFLRAGKTLVGVGVDAETTTKILQATTDAVAGFGGTSEDIEMVATAFSHMATSGRLSMQEVNSLSSKGVQALKILGNQYNVTTDDMRDMISSGAVPANKAIELLTDGIENGTDGVNGYTQAMAGMAESLKAGSLTGAFDSINSAIRSFSLALTGINPTLKETDAGYAESQKRIEQLTAAVTTLSEIIPLLAKVFSGVTSAIGDMLNWLVGTNVVLDDSSKKWVNVNGALGDFKRYLETTPTDQLAKIGNLLVAIAVTGPALMVVGKAMQVLGAAITAYNAIVKMGITLHTVYKMTMISATAAATTHTVVTKAQAVATGLVTAAQYALNTAMKANPAGVILVAVVALVSALVALSSVLRKVFPEQQALTKASREQSQEVSRLRNEYESLAEKHGESADVTLKAKAALDEEEQSFAKSAQTIQQFTDECNKAVEDHRSLTEELDRATEKTDAEAGKILHLADTFERLNAKTNRTIEDNARLSMVSQELSNSVDGVTVSVNENTGAVDGNADAVVALAKAEADRLRAATRMEEYSRLLEEQEILAMKLEMATRELEAADIDVYFALGNLQFANDQQLKAYGELQDAASGLSEEFDENARRIELLSEIQDEAAIKSKKLSDAHKEVAAETLTAAKAAEKYEISVEELTKYIEDQAILVQDEYNEVIEETIEQLQGLVSEHSGLKSAMEASGLSMSDLAQNMVNAGVDVDTLKEKMNSFADVTTAGFEQIDTQSKVTTTKMKENFDVNAANTEAWATNIATLHERAGSESETNFIKYIESLGLENASLAQELVDGTGASLSELADSYGSYSEIAATRALEMLGLLPEGAAEILSETEAITEVAGNSAGMSYGDGAASGLEASAGEVQAAAENIFSGLDSSFSQMAARATEAGTEISSNLADSIVAGQGQIDTNVTTIAKAIVETYKAIKLAPIGKQMSTDLATGISSGNSSVAASMRIISNSITSALNAMASQAHSLGTQISAGVARGISSGSYAVSSAMKSVAQSAVSAAKQELDVRSPSRVMYKIFQFVIQGAVNALDDGRMNVARAMESVIGNTISAANGGMEKLLDALSLDEIDFSKFAMNLSDLSINRAANTQLAAVGGTVTNHYTFTGDFNLNAKDVEDIDTFAEFGERMVSFGRS